MNLLPTARRFEWHWLTGWAPHQHHRRRQNKNNNNKTFFFVRSFVRCCISLSLIRWEGREHTQSRSRACMFGSVVVVVCGYVHFEFQRKKRTRHTTANRTERRGAKRSRRHIQTSRTSFLCTLTRHGIALELSRVEQQKLRGVYTQETISPSGA